MRWSHSQSAFRSSCRILPTVSSAPLTWVVKNQSMSVRRLCRNGWPSHSWPSAAPPLTWPRKRPCSLGAHPGLQPTYWLIENYVGIQTAVNEGALFGMGAGLGASLLALSLGRNRHSRLVGCFGAIESWWLSIALGCVMAGIFGNLYDRLGLWWQSDYPAEWKSASAIGSYCATEITPGPTSTSPIAC